MQDRIQDESQKDKLEWDTGQKWDNFKALIFEFLKTLMCEF